MAGALFAIITSWMSDRLFLRSPFLFLNCILGIIGFSMIGWCHSNPARYAGVFIALFGATANVPGAVAWAANNIVGQSKRAFSTALT